MVGRSRRDGILAARATPSADIDNKEDDSSEASVIKSEIKCDFQVNNIDDDKKAINSDVENLSLSGDEG